MASTSSGETKVGSKKISLSLTARYASTWGTWEGIRELVQNWHDGLYDGNMSGLSSQCHGTHPNIVFKEVQKDLQYEIYEAAAGTGSVSVLGFLVTDKMQNKLHLINRNTSLQTKILLLGYSKKSETANVIGQFGEGLKIGALALVREGRIVTMTTNQDVWHFALSHDEHFEEKVLAVFVSERTSLEAESFPVTMEKEDTITTVTCEYQEWKKYKYRFLFLNPAQDEIKTEIGSLLLDSQYQGQLYVKGVWVSDLSGEDLVTGVNFVNLRIDRDRNAVPRPSEIDHMVSCMWVKALESKPQLAEHYFKLLQRETNRDVRQAVEYASDSFAKLIAEEFCNQYGENVFATDTETSQCQLNQIRQELQKKAVICNNTLLKLLRKSGRFRSLEEELLNIGPNYKERKILSLLELDHEERSVVSHAVQLVMYSHPQVALHLIDIVDFPCANNEGCSMNGGRYEIPSWMVRDHSVRHINSCQQPKLAQCMCRQVRIACSLSFVLESTAQVQMSDTFSSIPTCCNHSLLNIVAPLALQVCKKAQGLFCENLHANSQKLVIEDHAECLKREKSLHTELQHIRDSLSELTSTQAESIKQLQDKLEQAENNAVSRELEYMKTEHVIQSEVQQKLEAVTKSYYSKLQSAEAEKEQLSQKLLTHQREQEYWSEKAKEYSAQVMYHPMEQAYGGEKAKEYSAQVSELRTCMERQHDVFLAEMMHYVNLCKNSTESLHKLCTEQLAREDTDGESKDRLQLLIKLSTLINEQLQKEKFLCMVCLTRRKEVVLIPCGHYMLCEDCTAQIKHSSKLCPICKTSFTRTVKVYT